MKKLTVLLLAGLVLLSACGGAKALTVENAWARPAPAGGTGGAFFTIHNPVGVADRLLSAQSPLAGMAELHLSKMENGVASMVRQDYVEVPAGGELSFAPGGYHVMLMGLKRELKPGDSFPLMLTFEKAGQLTVQVEVKAP
jgi:copper(I)-binding protein